MNIIKTTHTQENGVDIPHIKVLWGNRKKYWYRVGFGGHPGSLAISRVRDEHDIRILEKNEDES